MPGGTLFPDTMKQYDDYTIREALHNCIAHQDFTLQQRINFVENPGYLYYSNAGTFIPGTLENALKNEEPQTHFCNECLCRAMVDFNMIDTVSRGIKKMFNEQWRRHFPMPYYEIDQIKKKVVVRIYGNEINKRYTDLLKTNDTLSLWDCISLDAVQKGRTIHEDVAQDLLKRGLIEGEASHYSISLSIAKNTNQLPFTQKQKDWIRRGCARWFYNISAMLVKKVPSEIVYTNISKMCFQPTRRKSNSCACLEIY